VDHAAYFKHGYLMFITYEETPEFHSIFKRFANVFEQTYTRFLDLQKAEKQAREAQIENALEKVRSRSLAMQHPNELVEVVQLLREEMGALGVEELETSSIYIHDDTSGLTQCWFTIKDADDPGKSVTDQMTIDLQDTWVGRQMNQFYGSGQDSTSILMKGDHRVEWIRYCEEMSDLFGTSEFYGDTIPERSYHLYKFSNGFLGAASPGNISDESWDLMRRATGAFSFAYTRFSDLQKAEESARRSRQQASLDRVRADISSMRSAEDLNKITPLVWDELTNLGIPFIRCGVFIIHEEEEQVEVYLSKPNGASLAVMHLPFGSSDLVSRTVDAWQQGSVYTQHWSLEEFLEWGQSMMKQGQVSDLESYQGSEEAPESLHLHFIPFSQGMLYVGSTGLLDDEEISLTESLAKAFSIAYARYEDFIKLEKAKVGIEEALTELKATQSQLIQQEKLASLGQLTAGIAHEIKNPLNFVNNFSDLSLELVEEVRDEIRDMRRDTESERSNVKREKESSPLEGSAKAECRRGVSDEATDDTIDSDLILDILDDIEANLKTIHKHGSRADSIVKSMLEHSRGGSGKMEPTNLNDLVKEFTNLSFHGMKAGKDPINVDMEFDLDDSIDEVMLIGEDFSRVILNLCNNGFDAMREKLTGDGRPTTEEKLLNSELKIKNYSPKLTIRTMQSNTNVTIEIEDNGPGIPEEMKDKILQPFFTTKKGTQGTGLGLSITNDIVKAHGGNLEVASQAGKRTTFTIELPK
ncbi:MAG TPA: ATP-binding protein, partial [Balneolaceae bacterium]|nr:ATP-binding protein [Balneolaceae bacterium]